MEEKKYVTKKESVTYDVAALAQSIAYTCMTRYITNF